MENEAIIAAVYDLVKDLSAPEILTIMADVLGRAGHGDSSYAVEQLSFADFDHDQCFGCGHYRRNCTCGEDDNPGVPLGDDYWSTVTRRDMYGLNSRSWED